MTISPVDFSALTNQRSDISKVAGDDFLKIQQQQLANMIQKETEAHALETKGVESSEDAKINVDEKHNNVYDKEERKHKDEPKEEAEEDNSEYVVYNDPDLGNTLDWKG